MSAARSSPVSSVSARTSHIKQSVLVKKTKGPDLITQVDLHLNCLIFYRTLTEMEIR